MNIKKNDIEPKDTNNDTDINDEPEINNIIQDTYLSNIIPPIPKLVILIISSIISFLTIFFIGKIQVDIYDGYINSNMTLYSSNSTFCQDLYLANINIIASVTALPLIILYIVIYKRRVFLVKRCKFRNIGLPVFSFYFERFLLKKIFFLSLLLR